MDFKTPFTKLLTLFIALNLVIQLKGLGAVNAADDPANQGTQEVTPAERKQLDEAKRLNQQLLEMEKQGEYSEAISPGRRALRIRKRILGEEHPDTATSLNNLASVYDWMGRYVEAERLYRQALKTRKQVLGKEHQDTADTFNNLGLLYWHMGKYGKAEPLLREALDIRKEILGEQHRQTAESLNNLGLLHYSTDQYAKAESHFQQAVQIWKEDLGEEHRRTVTGFNNLGAFYSSMGEYAKAEPLYRSALQTRKEILGEEHPHTALSLDNLALLYEKTGRYAKAKPLMRQALEIRKEVFGGEHWQTAHSFISLGLLHHSIGDYAKAESFLRQALETSKKASGENHPRTAKVLNNLATVHESMGDYPQAEQHYQQALDINRKALGEDHLYTAYNLGNLGSLYTTMDEYEKAKAHSQQALDVIEQKLGKEHPRTAAAINKLGMIYARTGELAKAIQVNRRALKIVRKVAGEEHPDAAQTLNNLGGLHYRQGEHDKAETQYREAVTISRKALDDAAQALSQRQQLAMGQMLRYQLDAYISLATDTGDYEKQAFDQVLRWKGATLVRQRRYRQVAQQPQLTSLFQQLQRVATQLASLARAAPNNPDKMSVWQDRLSDLRWKKETLEAKLADRSAAFRKAKESVTLPDVTAALPQNGTLVDFFEYSKAIPPAKQEGSWSHQRSLVAFVVSPSKPVRMFDLGPAEPVSQAIDTWRNTFGTSPESQAAGRTLRKSLWEPLLTALGDSEPVLVSPDGALGRLPLAALPGKEPGTYLLEDHRLATVPVPQLLPALVEEQGREPVQKKLLLMGDVDYDAGSGQEPRRRNRRQRWSRRAAVGRGTLEFPPLAATGDEVTHLEMLFRDAFGAFADEIVKLKNAAASESRFRRQAPDCRHLHLATHGFFAPPAQKSALSPEVAAQTQQPMRGSIYGQRQRTIRGVSPNLLSGLAFAGANGKPEAGQDDGILTAAEIAFLPLAGVDLVTLSACETGLGKVAGGEGLLGVQRAFQVSGARTTVASLWKVDDTATRQLMERFYRNYWEEEMSKLDALREAQLWMLDDAELPRGDAGLRLDSRNQGAPARLPPEYWAAFTLSGDWH